MIGSNKLEQRLARSNPALLVGHPLLLEQRPRKARSNQRGPWSSDLSEYTRVRTPIHLSLD